MKFYRPWIAVTLAAVAAVSTVSAADNELTDQEKSDGYVLLFNGKDLNNWQFRPEFWCAKDGTITGKTTADCIPQRNTFCIYKGGEFGDFELHAKFKQTPGDEKGFSNSGIQYRSKVAVPDYCVVHGYQADMEAGKSYTGILYEEGGRGILAKRGEKVVIHEGKDAKNPKKPNLEVVGSLGDSKELETNIKHGEWNDYVIIAKGNHLQHIINGKPMVDVIDETAVGAKTGIIALQIHKGPPMNV